MSEAPPPEVQDRAAAVLGWRPQRWRRVHGGYTPTARYVGQSGRDSCFLKLATTRITAWMLRREAAAYQVIAGDYVPAFLGWENHPDAPLLLIEDLSHAVWPPPWTPAQIDQVLAGIEAMHGQIVDLPPISTNGGLEGGWSAVAVDPASFLSLGLASAAWLERALPALVAAEARCPVDGPTLAHFDLRSDNICFTDAGPKFIDWAAAGAGDPALDLAGWLPSLEAEGGPKPDAILRGCPEAVAWVSGYFAARAGLPIIPDAPRVRDIQRVQLTSALPWAQRALALPPLV